MEFIYDGLLLTNEMKQESFDNALIIVNDILAKHKVGSSVDVRIESKEGIRDLNDMPNTFDSWVDVLTTDLFNDCDDFRIYTDNGSLYIIGIHGEFTNVLNFKNII